MKNFRNWIWVISITIPTFSMAQPPEEEVAPIAPEFNIEITEAPVPETVEAPSAPATNAQILPTLPAMPVVPLAPAKAPEEDKSVKGITLSPAVTLKPLGYNGERDVTYFEISPSAGLNSMFKSAQQRDISLSINYAFTWDETLSNRAAGLRYFEHDLTGSASIDWTDSFSTSLSGEFDYSLWASTNREYAIYSDEVLAGKFKINPAISVVAGYHLFLFNDLDSQYHLSDGTYPSDGDDVRQGNAAISGSDQFYIDPSSSTFNYDPAVGNVWFANNGLQISTSVKPVKGTGLGLAYEYVFATFTNTPDTDWHGHWIVASFSQELPWKGGTLGLKNQVRLRNYLSRVNDDGSLAANARNRLTFTIDQVINDSISAGFYYRWEIGGSNADNYAAMKNVHLINLGFTFAF